MITRIMRASGDRFEFYAVGDTFAVGVVENRRRRSVPPASLHTPRPNGFCAVEELLGVRP